MSGYKKPLPRIDEESRGYWEALARHEFYFQRCRACGTKRFPPRAVCPSCLSSATDWVRASGRGTVYSYTITHQNQAPGFREALPYVLAIVELEEGVRLMTNVVGGTPDAVRVGMPVVVQYEDVTDEITLPMFRVRDPA
ncbi:MAG: Zn-ribbon domain-containing OB-fold protein [Candidatus Binatia bacterium]